MQKQLRSIVTLAAAVAACSAFGDIKWAATYKAAMDQAKTGRKLVMVEFYATWDSNSQHLEQGTFSDKTAQGIIGKCVPVRINIEKEGKDLGKKFHITNYPTVLFVDNAENVAGIIDGYETPDEFVKHGKAFLKDHADLPGVEAKYKSNSKDLDAITHLGVIYADRYQIQPALGKLAEAQKIDPSNKTDKLSDLYNDVADYYQNAGQYDPAIKYFKVAAETSKTTDKRAYGYLSIVACYLSMAQLDPSIDYEKPITPEQGRAFLKAAQPYVEAALKLPNLKPDDMKIAKDDKSAIERILRGVGDGGG